MSRRMQRLATLRCLRILRQEVENASQRAEQAANEIAYWMDVCERHKERISTIMSGPLFKKSRPAL